MQACGDFRQIPNRWIHIFPLVYTGLVFLALLFTAMVARCWKAKEKVARSIFTVIQVLVSAVAWDQLWRNEFWVKGNMGFGGLVFSLILILSCFTTLVLWEKGNTEGHYNGVTFRELLKLYIVLVLLAIAYAFGAGSGLVKKMSEGFVFLCAASLCAAFWIDQYMGRRYLLGVISLLIVLSVCLSLTSAYKKPYRLPAKVKDQVIMVTFAGMNGAVFVDEKTANYLNDLKKNALGAGWKPGMYLIDMTGGSPGATVILGGRAPGAPWLLGGYKGSNAFARVTLASVSRKTLLDAWILTAHGGKRKLSDDVLLDLGLGFPSDYEMVGQVRTGHRNEEQMLWRPMNDYLLEH